MSAVKQIKGVQINAELNERIQRITEQTGATFSEIARRALVAYLEKLEAKQAVLEQAGL